MHIPGHDLNSLLVMQRGAVQFCAYDRNIADGSVEYVPEYHW